MIDIQHLLVLLEFLSPITKCCSMNNTVFPSSYYNHVSVQKQMLLNHILEIFATDAIVRESCVRLKYLTKLIKNTEICPTSIYDTNNKCDATMHKIARVNRYDKSIFDRILCYDF